jgi:hypothetical protein
VNCRQLSCLAFVALGAASHLAAAPEKKPPAKPLVSKPAATAKPATAKPPAPPPPAPARFTSQSISAALRGLGYTPTAAEEGQRLRIEEEGYSYVMDVKLSASSDWLVCMAHLGTVPDLTKVPAGPLLTLLSTNDQLIGMSFSYDRVNGRIMLNAAVPNRGLAAEQLKFVIEGLKETVRRTEGLWDPAQW